MIKRRACLETKIEILTRRRLASVPIDQNKKALPNAVQSIFASYIAARTSCRFCFAISSFNPQHSSSVKIIHNEQEKSRNENINNFLLLAFSLQSINKKANLIAMRNCCCL
jgi:hypothetical protein